MNTTVSKKQQSYPFAINQDDITLIEIPGEHSVTHIAVASFDTTKAEEMKKELKDLASSVRLEGSVLRKKMAALASQFPMNNYREKGTEAVRYAIQQWKKYGSTEKWFRSGEYSFHDGKPRVGSDLRTYDAFYDESNILESGRILVKPTRLEAYVGILECDKRTGTITFDFFDKNKEEPVEIPLFQEVPLKFHTCMIDADKGCINEAESIQGKYGADSLEKINNFLEKRIAHEKENHACNLSQKQSKQELFLQEILHIRTPYHAPYEKPSIPQGVKVYTIE